MVQEDFQNDFVLVSCLLDKLKIHNHMSYKLIRNGCVGSLVAILFFLGGLTFIVTNRVTHYDDQLTENLSHIVSIRQLEGQLHSFIIEIQRVIEAPLTDIEPILTKLDHLRNVYKDLEELIRPHSKTTLPDELAAFDQNLRRMKVSLINFSDEVRYDPSADTTLGLERIVMEVNKQSDELFSKFAEDVSYDIQVAHERLGNIVRQARGLSLYGLIFGVGLGILVAAILARALSRPIQTLILGTEEVAKGNFDNQISIKSADEFGHLAKSFNSMTEALKEKETIKVQLQLTHFSVDHASDTVFWIDRAGFIIYANKSACEKLGYHPNEISQQTIFDIDYSIHNEEWPNQWDKFKKIKRMSMESHHITRNGSTFPVEITCDFLCHQDEEYLFLFCRDIGKRKKEEAARTKLESQLQRAKKMEAIGALAGGVAHDLNNILSGIVSYPELLLMEIDKDSPMRKPLLTIQKSGNKAAAIVHDLLTLSRRGVSVKKVINLNSVITEYLDSPEYKKLIEFHPNVTVQTSLDPDILNIVGSPVHISKTVMNLVSNAAEAISDAGTIHIRTNNLYNEKKSVEYEEIPEGEYTVLNISDTGIGMTAEEQEKIFEPFFSKKVMGRSGTGLGMAVVWGTVKDHRGLININSEQGSGTNIKLFFPSTRERDISQEKLPRINDLKGNGELVLVVDDVEEQREIAVAMLTQLGYAASSVHSGEAAISWLKKHHAGVILLDMIMAPGIDGLDTYLAIVEFRPKQQAIIASGYSESEKVRQATEAGASQYIKKPYSITKLGIAVQKALNNVEGLCDISL